MYLKFWEILLRLGLAVLIGMFVGYEREAKNRPAGMRTHVLVCVGSAIVALIQMEVSLWVLDMANSGIDAGGAVRSDPVRLIAQVVSGIGFLGAGTIVFDRRKITGLTTAASLWAVAALGLAAGMGFYYIAVLGAIVIYIVLSFLANIIQVNTEKKIEIRYRYRTETKEFIQEYFENKRIEIINVDFSVVVKEEGNIYTTVYTIDAPVGITYPEIIEDLSINRNVMRIRVVAV